MTWKFTDSTNKVVTKINEDGMQLSTLTSNLSADELAQVLPADPVVVQQVSMRQCQLALHQIGKLSMVESAINAMPSPMKEIAQIEWKSANVDRSNPFVSALGAAIGLSESEIDSLFNTAAGL